MNDSELALHSAQALVPSGYAEKAMASLMQLHSELMDEKERRVDLYRRLMEKEQAIAELRMYVKLLEEKLARSPPVEAVEPEPAPAERPPPRLKVAPPPLQVDTPPPRVVAAGARRRIDGWKAW
ncbi:MAG: hypothetical protein HYZ28_07340 [Myxococcales bacterium]|nr:hypothetical protein [Myxococcales bacterium]